MQFLNAVGSTEWNHIHLHYIGVKAIVSETEICEIWGGKKCQNNLCIYKALKVNGKINF